MTTGNIIRFTCVLLLWLALCYILLTRAARIDFMVLFAIVASLCLCHCTRSMSGKKIDLYDR